MREFFIIYFIGLAQAAMHGVETSNVITQNLLDNSASTPSLISAFAQKVSLKSTPTSLTPFAILGRMLKDPRLEIKKPNSERFFKDVIKEHGHIVEEYAALWDADTSTSAEVTKRIEELAWVVALVYGVGGFKKGKPFTADFFMYAFAPYFKRPELNLLSQDAHGQRQPLHPVLPRSSHSPRPTYAPPFLLLRHP